MRFLNTKINNDSVDQRLDETVQAFVSEFFKKPISKTAAKNLITHGFVYLNRKLCKICSKKLVLNAKVSVIYPFSDDLQIIFSFAPRDILFEDDFLIAINKPAGIPSQSTQKKTETNLHDELIAFLTLRNPARLAYVGLLHRLDKGTSGVLLFSKSKLANKSLSEQFQNQELKKTYQAVTVNNGDVNKGKTLLRGPWSIKNRLVRRLDPYRGVVFDPSEQEGQSAETCFSQIKNKDSYSLVEANPLTGCMHQIRSHLLSSQSPILGDTVYNKNSPSAERMFLHAHTLMIKHPKTKRSLNIVAPTPPEFLNFFN